jgi:AcrR family transcriptional regulator
MRHETIDLIFDAAVEVFAEYGFERAKVDDIAIKAGIAKGTIYYHFKSKEELFIALMNEGLDKMLDHAKMEMERVGSPREQLRHMLAAQVRFLIGHGTFTKLLLTEVWGSKERQQAFRSRIRQYTDMIEQVLRNGVNQGIFHLTHPNETAASIFGAVSVAVLHTIYRCQDQSEQMEAEIPKIIDSLEHLLFTGITA